MRRSNRSAAAHWAVGFLLAAQAALLALPGLRNSAGLDEMAHLAAGLLIAEHRRFDLYSVNPPLVKSMAAVPLLAARPHMDWQHCLVGPGVRSEWRTGEILVAANAENWHWYLVLARWTVIPLCVAGGYVCWLWARRLYGTAAGLLALALWCFCPTVLGWGATITADAGSAATGVLSGWLFWRWLRQPSWGRALWAAVGLGLAELTKFTWVVLFGLWPVLWVFWRKTANREVRSQRSEVGAQRADFRRQKSEISEQRSVESSRRPPFKQLAVILLIGVYLINLGYLFEGSFTPLGEFRFISDALAGNDLRSSHFGNRFEGAWLGGIPVPLPVNYVSGIDTEKRDFEDGMSSYLNGEWKHGGWWHYYLWCVLYKVPVGTQLLFLMAVGMSVSGMLRAWHGRKTEAERLTSNVERLTSNGKDKAATDHGPRSTDRPADEHSTFNGPDAGLVHPSSLISHPSSGPGLQTLDTRLSTSWRDTVVLLAPAVAVFVLVSSQTGFSRYLRYLLPCFPFVFIYISRVATVLERSSTSQERPGRLRVAARQVFWLKAFVAGCLAWSMFSSLSVYPHSMSYFNELAGGPTGGHRYLLDANIDWGQDMWRLKEWYDDHPEARPLHLATHVIVHPRYYGIEYVDPPHEPQPGWYVMSVHYIHDQSGRYEYFLDLEPVAMAGYSNYIYHVTLDDANRVRRELGLPPSEARNSQ